MLLRRILGGSSLMLGMGGLLIITPPTGGSGHAGAADTTKPGLPLTAARTARFTTTKATWTSLDVSPDGQTIVFDMLGDLYRIPVAGGKATRLTSGLPYDAQPRFSPDGKRVVFVSDRTGGENLFTMAPDGGDVRQLTPPGNYSQFISPEWTPDGHYVVVGRSAGFGTPKLWLYDVEGGTGLLLTRAPGPQAYFGPAFGPDGRYIYYAMRLGLWQYNASMPQFQLGVYDRETGQTTTITSRYGSGFRPAVSPDGKWLVYGSRENAETGLRIRELASGAERWLAYPVQRDNMEAAPDLDVLPGYSFLPDGKALVVSYGGQMWRVPVDGTAAVNIPFSVDAEVAVGPEVKFEYPIPDSATFTVRQIRDPAVSPDGKRVAFTALDRLYVADLPAGAPRRVSSAETGEYYPAWSPDGAALAYVTWDGTDGEIMRTDLTGGQPTRLTRTSAFYQTPAWSPDGQRIVAVRSSARNLEEQIDPFIGDGFGAEFFWIPATGGDGTTIRPTGGLGTPHFTQDSSRIFAYGFLPAPPGEPPTAGGPALVSFRFDGTDLRQHVRILGPLPLGVNAPNDDEQGDVLMPPRDWEQEPTNRGRPAGAVLMAPRGDFVLAQVGNDMYVARVPQVGGDIPVINVSTVDSAQTRTLLLTDIGGEFPSWSADGRTIHWGIGNAFVSYDLARGLRVDDSLRAAGVDSVTRWQGAYHPSEHRFLIAANRDLPEGTVVLRGAPRHHHEGPGGDRECGRGGPQQPDRERGPARLGARRCPGHRRHRQDHHPRLRRHPCPHVAGLGGPLEAALDLSRQLGLRRHHHPRSPDLHHRRPDLSGPGRSGAGDRPPGLLHRPRRLQRRPGRQTWTGPGTCSSATASTTTPRPSRCTWPATARPAST